MMVLQGENEELEQYGRSLCIRVKGVPTSDYEKIERSFKESKFSHWQIKENATFQRQSLIQDTVWVTVARTGKLIPSTKLSNLLLFDIKQRYAEIEVNCITMLDLMRRRYMTF